MFLYLDSANLSDVQEISKYPSFKGVTTNPTILSRETKERFLHLQEMRKLIEGDLFVQLVGTTFQEMKKDFELVEQFANNNKKIIYKVPITDVGLQIIKMIKEKDKNNKILGTTIYTVQQALLACFAGCDYIAPYYNRIIKNKQEDPNQMIAKTRKFIDQHNLSCRIIAASFKSASQVEEAFLAGAHSCTLSLDIYKELVYDETVENDIQQFEIDHQKSIG